MKSKNRKAELTTQQIVVITILVASFAVLLFFLIRLNLGEETQKEICHNSVILKGKGSTISGSGTLDCKTNYVCISSSDNGVCKDFVSTEIKKVSQENKNETLKTIADEMAGCWWMFGEGKIDYSGAKVSRACTICSVIGFDSINQEITYTDLQGFLKSNSLSGKQEKYFDYLFSGGVPKIFETGGTIDYTKKYYVVTGRTDSVKIPFIGTSVKDATVIPVHFVDSDELTNLKCDSFITKA
ncbi:MAG TPA: hypothetical protein VJZ93_02830 [Candidatus Nanoarchaeia archaeon]|nr:hypothetical protein [Candidatus Nanoarchaeia archaeon]